MADLLFEDKISQIYQTPQGLLQVAKPQAPAAQWNPPVESQSPLASYDPSLNPPPPIVNQSQIPMMTPQMAAVPKPPKEKPSVLEQSFNQQANALQKHGQAAYNAGQEEAAARQGYADYLDQTMAQRQKLNEEANQKAAEALDAYQSEKQKLKEMDIKDPWAKMSTGSQIGAAIAMGLGAYASAMGAGPNYAMKIINDAIDRDLAIQGKQLEKQKEAVGESKEYIQLVRQQFATKEQQLLALKDMKLEATMNQIEGIKSAASGQEAKAKADQMIGALGTQRLQTQAQLANITSEMEARKMQARTSGRQQLTAAAVKEIADLDTATQNLVDLRNTYQEKVGTLGALSQYIPASEAKKYNDQRKVAAQTIGSILEGGKLTEEDYARYYDMLPSPSDSKDRVENKLSNISAMLTNKRNAQIKGYQQAGFATNELETLNNPLKTEKHKIIEDAKLWISKNPQDPRVPLIKQKLGL